MKTLSVQVTFVIKVPEDTDPGDFYFGDCLEDDPKTLDGFKIEDYSTDSVEII